MAMRAPGFIKTPFANTGDKTPIPTDAQPNGSVSFATGWGPDYQRDQLTDPAAKPIDRSTTNYLMNSMSQLLQRWQTENAPEWIAPEDNGGVPYPYTKGAVVTWKRGDGKYVAMVSLVGDNTKNPSSAAIEPGTRWPAWVDLAEMVGNNVSTLISTPQAVAGQLTVAGPLLLPTANNPTGTPSTQAITSLWATEGRVASFPINPMIGQSGGGIILPAFLTSQLGGGTRLGVYWGGSVGPKPDAGSADRNVSAWQINFPFAFSGIPSVFVNVSNDLITAGSSKQRLGIGCARNVNGAGFTAVAQTSQFAAMEANPQINWLAIGPV